MNADKPFLVFKSAKICVYLRPSLISDNVYCVLKAY